MDMARDLVYLEKLLMTTKKHYENPHSEAMTLKLLWTYDEAPNKEREIEMSENFLEEATKLFENRLEPREKVLVVIKKGLRISPRSHQLYALRGEIYAEKKDWEKSIKWYETARRMLKFDDTSRGESKTKELYKEKLQTSYWGRGKVHEKNGKWIEAVADFEQVLLFCPRQNQLFVLQDMLLKCLRILDKYEAYCVAWSEFVKTAKPQRTADLMTQLAEFKIHMREIAAARRMLHEAISLDKNNVDAHELLQVIFDTGHTMLGYAIIWCINGCYDKALMTIEKGADCDPYNPGLTVLKTIVLRLSGQFREAMQWLETADKAFYKLLEPSLNKRGTIMGKITVDQTKSMLIDQWYLIRYDMALEHTVAGRYEEAIKVLRNEKLLKRSLEARLLVGDCLMSQGKLDEALKSYLDVHKASISGESQETSSKKRFLIAQRITEILNSKSLEAVQKKGSEKSLRTAEICLKVLSEQKIANKELGFQRCEALMYTARSRYQKSTIKPSPSCLKALGDSFSFGRGVDDGGLRDSVFGKNRDLDNIINCFSTEKKFPYRTKILMQN